MSEEKFEIKKDDVAQVWAEGNEIPSIKAKVVKPRKTEFVKAKSLPAIHNDRKRQMPDVPDTHVPVRLNNGMWLALKKDIVWDSPKTQTSPTKPSSTSSVRSTSGILTVLCKPFQWIASLIWSRSRDKTGQK